MITVVIDISPTGETGVTVNINQQGVQMTTVPILDNQVVPVVLYQYKCSDYPYTNVIYSVERGTARDIYNSQKVTDGVTVVGGQNKNSVGTTGVTITQQVALVGGIPFVQILYTSTAVGFGGTFKYGFINQWK